MMKFNRTTNQEIHSRRIDITTYKGTTDSFIVEGVLKDERLVDSYGPTGKLFPPGTIHHMIIRIEVRGPSLVIEDIEVEMPTLPNEFCIETIKCLDPIKGMQIVSGFTSKVKNLVGGVKGCVHLVALLTAMAPAAFQGVFSGMDREQKDPKMVSERMKNTCWVWRANGPLMNQLKDAQGRPRC
ncbi:MAG: DUF2889 domain-containing protein [Desulfobacteraceae bacterium]|nr:MAG: DUF2889 domain-containing protein [Desulfobacteraceae bacterium]